MKARNWNYNTGSGLTSVRQLISDSREWTWVGRARRNCADEYVNFRNVSRAAEKNTQRGAS
jgi:hypothetical protein